MTQRELRELALNFVRDELPFEFEDCVSRLLDRFPTHLHENGCISDFEAEELVYSDHYINYIKAYLHDFITGKVFMSVQQIPTTSIAIQN